MIFYLGGVTIIIFLIVLAHRCDLKREPKIRKIVEELYINGEFSSATDIGSTYTNFKGGGGMFTGIAYSFEISISNKHPNGIVAAGLGDAMARQISEATYSAYKRFLSDVKREDRFLVLYDKNDPKNAILLLDHPIKSEEDFERYKAEIEELRKDPEWRGFR